MNDDEIRIAVAECCGWKRAKHFEQILSTGEGETWDGWEDPRTEEWFYEPPDFCTDLNACAEMEKTLSIQLPAIPHKESERTRYVNHLDEMCGNKGMVMATARQRCEAFLKVKGLWKP